MKTPLPFQRSSIAAIVLSDTKNPGKADFPGTRSIRRTDRFTFDFRGRVGEIRAGYFSGGRRRKEGGNERDEREERTQLPLLPILLAPGENIYILSLRGPGIVPRGILIRTISDIQYRSKAVLA